MLSRENLFLDFSTLSDVIQAIQPQTMVRGLKLRINEGKECSGNTGADQLHSYEQLIWVRLFVFTYAKSRFPYHYLFQTRFLDDVSSKYKYRIIGQAQSAHCAI